jgi:23S rRNA (cytidine1920-2'-O)/16S rRNA (cytidine1409-2'-O)-methyltransferase
MIYRRLDQEIANRKLAISRSQAENYIKLGLVQVNGRIELKASAQIIDSDQIEIIAEEQFVSRAGMKLASIAKKFEVNFKNKVVLDVGSSTGGFSDFAVKKGAKKIFAIDVGSNQLHQSLRQNPIIELHEQTDIRNFVKPNLSIDIILIDVSFISLKMILPDIYNLSDINTQILAMFKPQFEAESKLKNKGVIKNARIRRDLIKHFENWLKLNNFYIIKSLDSGIAGSKGNLERFFLLKKV